MKEFIRRGCKAISVILFTIAVLVFLFKGAIYYNLFRDMVSYQYSEMIQTTVVENNLVVEPDQHGVQEEMYNQLTASVKQRVEEVQQELVARNVSSEQIQQMLQDNTLNVEGFNINDPGMQYVLNVVNVPHSSLQGSQRQQLFTEMPSASYIRMVLDWIPIVLMLPVIILAYLGWWGLVTYSEEDAFRKEYERELEEDYQRRRSYMYDD